MIIGVPLVDVNSQGDIGAVLAQPVRQFGHAFSTSRSLRRFFVVVQYRGQVVFQQNKEAVLGSLEAK